MKKRLMVVSLALMTMLLSAWPVSAGSSICDDESWIIDETVHGNVVVTAGAWCVLGGSEVQGNVRVEPGGTLMSFTNTIWGNIDANGPDRIMVWGNYVDGNVTVSYTHLRAHET